MPLHTYFIFCLRSANAVIRAAKLGAKTIEEVARITRLPVEEVNEWDKLLSLNLEQHA